MKIVDRTNNWMNAWEIEKWELTPDATFNNPKARVYYPNGQTEVVRLLIYDIVSSLGRSYCVLIKNSLS